MSEAEKRRGWWSRLVGEGAETVGEGPSAEEIVAALTQELATARETIDALASEREALRAEAARREAELRALLTRAGAEAELLQRTSEQRLAVAAKDIEQARSGLARAAAEHARALAERDAKARQLAATLSVSETRIAGLQRDVSAAGRELAAARQALAQEQGRTTRALEDLGATRNALVRSEAELADARTARARERREAEAKLGALSRALAEALGDGAVLALRVAARSKTTIADAAATEAALVEPLDLVADALRALDGAGS